MSNELDKSPEFQLINDKIKAVIDKLDNTFEYVDKEDLKSLETFMNPELRIKILSQLFFLERLKKSKKLSSMVEKAVNKLEEYLNDENLQLKPRELMELVRTLSEVDTDTIESVIKYSKEPAKVIEGDQINIQSNSTNNTQINNVALETLQRLDPVKLENIVRLSEKIIEAKKEGGK